MDGSSTSNASSGQNQVVVVARRQGRAHKGCSAAGKVVGGLSDCRAGLHVCLSKYQGSWELPQWWW